MLLCIQATPAGEIESELPGGSGTVPTALIELDGTSSENYDGGKLTYDWTQIDGPKVELSDPHAAKPYFRTGKPGLYRFQLVVTSGTLKSDPFVVEIMIERDNQPPVAVSPKEKSCEVGQPIEIDGSKSYDPDGSALIYRWRFLSGDPGVPAEALDKPLLSFVPNKDGVYELELVVSDGETASRPSLTRLYIKPQPRQPVAKAKAVAREIPSLPVNPQAMAPSEGAKPIARIEGPAVGKSGESMMLDARGSRGSGSGRLNYLWRQKSGPFINDFENVFEGAAERFTPPRAGDYEFELIVSDGVQESDPVFHSVKVVNDSDPPVAVVVAPERVMPGALVKLDATQSYDLEGSPLTYRWRQTGGPKVTRYLIDDNLGDSSPAFHPPTPGTYSFELIVSNGRLQSRPVEVDIAVGDTATPLKVEIDSPQVVGINDTFTLVAKVTGSGGKSLVLNWRQVEGPAGSRGKPEGEKLHIALLAPGRYVFDVSAVENGKVIGTARRVVEAFNQDAKLAMTGNSAAPAMPPPPSSSAPVSSPGLALPPPMPPAFPPPAPLGESSLLGTEPLQQPLEQLQPLEPLPMDPVPAIPLPPAIPIVEPAQRQSTSPASKTTTVSYVAPTQVTDKPTARPIARIHPSTLGGSAPAVQSETYGDQVRRVPGAPNISGF